MGDTGLLPNYSNGERWSYRCKTSPIATLTEWSNLARIGQPDNSIRGIVLPLIGPTFPFAAINFISISDSSSFVHLKYTTQPNPRELPSLNPT